MSRLERWSRLKRNAKSEDESLQTPLSSPAEPIEERSAEQHVALDESSQQSSEVGQEPPAIEPEPGSLDHTLPDPETLEAGSDFSAFMLPGVSGALRRRALKRLWATGNYNVRDGLDDYDADYHQQLKPMASELASKLRRWTHKAEEAVDKELESNQDETKPHTSPPDQGDTPTSEPDNEQHKLTSEETSASCTPSNNAVKTHR